MYKQISANIRLTWGLIIFFVVTVIAIGYIFAQIFDNTLILVIAVFIALVQSLISYYYSDKIALLTTGAKKINRKDYIELFRIVENLCIASGSKQPDLYVINDQSPNAFATGRNPKNASLAVTTGLLQRLNKSELEGVISHELSHIKNYDILVMTVVVVLVGIIALISDYSIRASFFRSNDERDSGGGYLILIGLVLAILAPISATLIQLAISRRREYLADASGALITRYPEGLASALEKISSDKNGLVLKNRAVSHLFIASPAKDDSKASSQSGLSALFSTHPPIKERVKRLREMIIKP